MITVVDYGRGNLFSIGQALRHLEADYRISSDPEAVRAADRIVLPGVGAFGDARAGLEERSLIEPLREAAERGVPLLGICVGAQLLLTCGEEFGHHGGLDLIPGVVKRLPEPSDDSDAIRIPNVGWRPLKPSPSDDFMDSEDDGSMVYFVHSFAPVVENPSHAAATITVNGADVPAIVHRDNVLGFQFHSEKSGPIGLGLIGRFLAI